MLPRLTVLLSVLCFALMGIGCGDDEPGDTTPDSGSDQVVSDVVDTGLDPVEETAPDVVEDVVPDTTPDLVEEPDVSELPEGACNTEDDCDEGQGCVGGGCVDPVEDLDEYAGEAATRPSSFTWKLLFTPALPQGSPDKACCFEYDNDPDPQDGVDNVLGELIAGVGGMAGITPAMVQDYLDTYIMNGTVNLVVDWKELPISSNEIDDGDVQMSWFLAEVDPAMEWEEVGTDFFGPVFEPVGTGTFYLEPTSFGEFGSLVQFNRATSASGVVSGGPSTFVFAIPPIPGYFEEGLTLHLEKAMIEAEVELVDGDVRTVDIERTGASEEEGYTLVGGKLGGVVNIAEIIYYGNEFLAANCACAGVGPTENVLDAPIQEQNTRGTWVTTVQCTEEFRSTEYAVDICCGYTDSPSDCVNGTAGTTCCVPNDVCTYVPMVCEWAGVIGGFMDTNLDNIPAPDGMSAGLRFGWTDAYIAGMSGTSLDF